MNNKSQQRLPGAAIILTKEGIKEPDVMDAKTAEAIESAAARHPLSKRHRRILIIERAILGDEQW